MLLRIDIMLIYEAIKGICVLVSILQIVNCTERKAQCGLSAYYMWSIINSISFIRMLFHKVVRIHKLKPLFMSQPLLEALLP